MINFELYLETMAMLLNIIGILVAIFYMISSFLKIIKLNKLNTVKYKYFKRWLWYYISSIIIIFLSVTIYILLPLKTLPILDIVFTVGHSMPLLLIHIIFTMHIKNILNKSKQKTHNYEF